jgi:hypothetical protein
MDDILCLIVLRHKEDMFVNVLILYYRAMVFQIVDPPPTIVDRTLYNAGLRNKEQIMYENLKLFQ